VKRLFKQSQKIFAWLFFAVLVAGLLSYRPLCAKAADQTTTIVGQADTAVRQAFNATLNAESAGANVSDLIARLNEAGGYLGEAETALGNNDSSGATSNASLCIGIAQSITSDANVLKASALSDAQTSFRMTIFFSVMGIAAFVVVLGLVWLGFKDRYVKKTATMKPRAKPKVKPEVASDEA
jgi:hypothetical protein